MRYPKNLPEGGTIGLLAPSFGCATEPYFSAFQNALKKWKVLGYLRRFLDQDIRQLETIAGYLKYKKKFLSLLERGFHNEMQQLFTKLNRIDKTDEASLEAISKELLQQIQYLKLTQQFTHSGIIY